MSIPKERIQSILGQFSLLFPPPVEGADSDAVVGLWVRLFHEYDLIQFNAASWALALKLKRFPFPADFVEEMGVPLAQPTSLAADSEAA